MEPYIFFTFIILLGGLASAAHGGDWLSKGYVLALNALLASLVTYWFTQDYVASGLSVVGAALYWLFVRVGKHKHTPFPMAGITLDYQGHNIGFGKLVTALGFWGCVCGSLLTYSMGLRVEVGVFIASMLFIAPTVTAMAFQNHDAAGRYMIKHGKGIVDNRRVFEFVSGCCYNGALMLAASGFADDVQALWQW